MFDCNQSLIGDIRYVLKEQKEYYADNPDKLEEQTIRKREYHKKYKEHFKAHRQKPEVKKPVKKTIKKPVTKKKVV